MTWKQTFDYLQNCEERADNYTFNWNKYLCVDRFNYLTLVNSWQAVESIRKVHQQQ